MKRTQGSPYCPRRGDIIVLDFDPQAGDEQMKRRPALVLTEERYNRATQLCVVCPIRSRARGYRTEIPLPAGMRTTGVLLADQVKSASWMARDGQFHEIAPAILLDDALDIIADLLGM